MLLDEIDSSARLIGDFDLDLLDRLLLDFLVIWAAAFFGDLRCLRLFFFDEEEEETGVAELLSEESARVLDDLDVDKSVVVASVVVVVVKYEVLDVEVVVVVVMSEVLVEYEVAEVDVADVVLSDDEAQDDERVDADKSVADDSSVVVVLSDRGGDCKRIFKLPKQFPPTIVSLHGICLASR